MIRVLELGNYVSVSYAGMILAEQGFKVEKWISASRPDPILGLKRGEELWDWINKDKRVFAIHARDVVEGPDVRIVLDNFRPSAWERWGIDRAKLAERNGWVWVGMQGEDGNRSFDVVAQMRAWGDHAPWLPFYIGDTSAGLWMAFKALAMLAQGETGFFPMGQASCLAKLVEGEEVVAVKRRPGRTPWDTEPYEAHDGLARIVYEGVEQNEPARDREWRLANLWHDGTGRFRI
jgi:crotonobetainyl-CoA:carnitine CoA-transferase CaiB-like acyl-CoA transferase